MNILKEACKRVREDVNKLTVNELLKINLFNYRSELLDYYIKEIKKELINKKN